MTEAREFHAGPDDSGRRLDRVLRRLLPGMPLSALYGALRKGRIKLNGRKAAPEARLQEGDLLHINISLLEGSLPEGRASPSALLAAARAEGAEPESESELALLKPYLVCAGKDLLFLNKPRGMPSHGPEGLDLLVGKALAGRMAASLSFSPGPLHRLDRNSSGLITFPRSAAGAREFTALLRAGGVRKRYLALLAGSLAATEDWQDLLRRDRGRERTEVLEPGSGRIDSEGGEKAALARSRAEPLLKTENLSLALVEIETGLTHQIRAQAGARAHPLAGDLKYGGGRLREGYFLHAWLLDLLERPFPDLPARLEAPLPPYWQAELSRLFGARALASALEAARNL